MQAPQSSLAAICKQVGSHVVIRSRISRDAMPAPLPETNRSCDREYLHPSERIALSSLVRFGFAIVLIIRLLAFFF